MRVFHAESADLEGPQTTVEDGPDHREATGAEGLVAVEGGDQAFHLVVAQHLLDLVSDLRRLERLEDVGVGVAVLVQPGREGEGRGRSR